STIQLCIAQGANVYVTTGSADKIKKAVDLGAMGRVNYKDADWPAQLADPLKKDGIDQLDVVIDSAGGLMAQVGKVLKAGGIVVCYGMTAGRQINMTMREVIRNQRLIGSTMGSKADLKDTTAFLEKHRILPAVSHVLYRLEGALGGFETMKQGEGFGKVVVDVS
ncbi:NAD(P)-binding protein, partial [Athelia psychrophila]